MRHQEKLKAENELREQQQISAARGGPTDRGGRGHPRHGRVPGRAGERSMNVGTGKFRIKPAVQKAGDDAEEKNDGNTKMPCNPIGDDSIGTKIETIDVSFQKLDKNTFGEEDKRQDHSDDSQPTPPPLPPP
jgi:hypothetical protein